MDTERSIRLIKAQGIREAIQFAEQALNDEADPVEALCITEDYANSIDPTVVSNVVSIRASK